MAKRILFISKYPPLQGGIASRTYWLAQELARRGHSIHVVTHAGETTPQYSCTSSEEAALTDVNITVHSTAESMPWHIPDDPERTLVMLDLCLRIVDAEAIDVVDSGYLVPYGIVGHLVQQLRHVPHVVRHGGSDIARFLDLPVLARLLADTLQTADAVVMDRLHEERVKRIRHDAICLPAYVPPAEFRPVTTRADRPPRVAYIGKVNYYWRFKELARIAAIMSSLAPDVETMFVAQGNGLESFRTTLQPEAASSTTWRLFVHPARMPRLLSSLDAVFALTSSQPHPDYSNLVAEAFCAGVGIITDTADMPYVYADVVAPAEGQVLVLPEGESASSSAWRIASWLKERQVDHPCRPTRRTSFSAYVSQNEAVYDAVAATRC